MTQAHPKLKVSIEEVTMALELSCPRYQVEIPPLVWAEFFELMTDDNRGRLITITLLESQLGEVEVIRHRPLYSMTYADADHGNDLVVTVSRSPENRQVTYAHRIVLPQWVTITTDEDGVMQSCRVTDNDQAQTILDFQT